ncbi:MAG: hypothetical protein KJ065_03960, partial [Anaerolineae bacterium]|nr:hypothetical protein [Anaerolineae bacterium]
MTRSTNPFKLFAGFRFRRDNRHLFGFSNLSTKEKSLRILAVVSGGDAPGINAALYHL